LSTTGLPQVVDGGQRSRRAPGVTGRRIGLGALLAGIAAATVAIPPLITPDKKAAPVPPVASAVPPAALVPAGTASPSHPAAPSATGPAPCAPAANGGTVEVTGRPACAIFTGGLGNGWTVTGDGMKVLPGEIVPGTRQTAMRVERSRPAIPATAVALTAKSAVGVAPGERLKLRVWGGRQFGTVLGLSVAPGGTGSVTLTAPADKWTTYSVRLSELTHAPALGRIELAVAADQVPNVNRFFLDDIAILG
jgi:hypothetical protein